MEADRMRVVLCGALLAATACGGGGSEDPGSEGRPATVRDSAGVTVVENGAEGAWAPGEGRDVREVVSLGSVDGPEETTWGEVVGMVPLAEGGVAVLDGQARRLRLFGRGGAHLASAGGFGRGPAEFDEVAGLAALGDTIAVWDWSQRKLVLFSPRGEFVTSRAFSVNVFRVGFPETFARLPSGDFLLVARNSCRVPRREGDNQWRVTLVAGDGSRTRTLRARELGGVVPIYGPPGTFCIRAELPFPERNLTALLPSGEVAYAHGSTYEVTVHSGPGEEGSGGDDPSGRIVRIVRRRAPPLAVSARSLTVHRERQRQRRLEEEKIALILDTLDGRPAPELRPPLDRMRSDEAGRLWLRRTPNLDDGTADWDVFGPEGLFLGSVELPARLEVHAVREGRIYGLVTDDLGTEVVKIYEVVAEEALSPP